MSFIEDNKKELQILAERVKELDTVRDCDSLKDLQARKHAINLVESWIEELFGIKKESIHELVEEDNIYTISEDRSNSEE